MSTTSSSTWANASTSEAPGRSAAVLRGIGLIGVVKGFARGVLELGRAMGGAVARMKQGGTDPYSTNASFEFVAVLSLLQRAVLMADALRARLRTPAVAVALARFGVARPGARKAPPLAVAEPDMDDPLWRIAHVRGDQQRRQGWREAIEDMSDREVLTYIHADLLAASAMLGENDVAAEIRALGCKASVLLDSADVAAGEAAPDDAAPDDAAPDDAAPDDAAPDTSAAEPVAHAKPDEEPEPDRDQGVLLPCVKSGAGRLSASSEATESMHFSFSRLRERGGEGCLAIVRGSLLLCAADPHPTLSRRRERVFRVGGRGLLGRIGRRDQVLL